jgi:triphosphoribosyl-dephospho-CoA synthase
MTAACLVANLKPNSAAYPCTPRHSAEQLAKIAVWALLEESELTPKPALVDQRGSGAHPDMDLEMLRRSATVLYPTFLELAQAAKGVEPSVELRRMLGAIGRKGEATMMRVTGGCNTHRGAIWSLGLLCAATASLAKSKCTAAMVCGRAGVLARFPDSAELQVRLDASRAVSHGALVLQRYGVPGARGEAEQGFPHVLHLALPVLHESRVRAASESAARLNALMTIMTTLDDTCLLHRGGALALHTAQRGAWRTLDAGGTNTSAGLRVLLELDHDLIALNSSPGGSADLLAAALLLDRLTGGK